MKLAIVAAVAIGLLTACSQSGVLPESNSNVEAPQSSDDTSNTGDSADRLYEDSDNLSDEAKRAFDLARAAGCLNRAKAVVFDLDIVTKEGRDIAAVLGEEGLYACTPEATHQFFIYPTGATGGGLEEASLKLESEICTGMRGRPVIATASSEWLVVSVPATQAVIEGHQSLYSEGTATTWRCGEELVLSSRDQAPSGMQDATRFLGGCSLVTPGKPGKVVRYLNVSQDTESWGIREWICEKRIGNHADEQSLYFYSFKPEQRDQIVEYLDGRNDWSASVVGSDWVIYGNTSESVSGSGGGESEEESFRESQWRRVVKFVQSASLRITNPESGDGDLGETDDWYKTGEFEWRWVPAGEIDCLRGRLCWQIEAISSDDCPSGAYAEIGIFDRNDRRIDWSNDYFGQVRSGERTVFTFSTFNDAAKTAYLESLRCFS